MSTHEQVIHRFAREAGKDDPKFLKGDDFVVLGNHEGYSSTQAIDTVYSYGHRHFPLARIMWSADGSRRGWWLLNGDIAYVFSGRPSPSTARHQQMVRDAVKETGLPALTVPFSALERGGIEADSIVPVEVLPERYTREPRVRAQAPMAWQLEMEAADDKYARNWQELPDGRWAYEANVHHLGESLFRARYSYKARKQPGYRDLMTNEWIAPVYTSREGEAFFLSAFDENEPGLGLYFLAQLPDGAQPATVAEARECLKPEIVKRAEAEGRQILRQGDVFAVSADAQTRQLPGPSKHMTFVLDVNHQVTEMRQLSGLTYGRGFMRHRPRDGRPPEHQTLKLGNGKTWYLLVRNTMPEGRSWSIGGYVD